MPLRRTGEELGRPLPHLGQVARLGARQCGAERARRQFQAPGHGVVVEVAVQPVANQPAVPCLEDGPGPDADVPQLLQMVRGADRFGLGSRQRLELRRSADGLLAQAPGAMEVDREVAHHLGKIDRQRGAALPELQDTVVPLHQPFEERLEDVVDILPVGARTDAVIDEPVVAPIERFERARCQPKDVVDQFDIGQFRWLGRRSRQGHSPIATL